MARAAVVHLSIASAASVFNSPNADPAVWTNSWS